MPGWWEAASTLRPGEISLAHHGVLFLDELPEFRRGALEVLRQPLEDGRVHLSRARGSARFPARFIVVGAMNPCPCGYHGDGTDRCLCPPPLVERYRGRVSGPLLDRMDLQVEVPAVSFDGLGAATLRRVHRGGPGAGHPGQRRAGATVQGRARRPRQRTDGPGRAPSLRHPGRARGQGPERGSGPGRVCRPAATTGS